MTFAIHQSSDETQTIFMDCLFSCKLSWRKRTCCTRLQDQQGGPILWALKSGAGVKLL